MKKKIFFSLIILITAFGIGAAIKTHASSSQSGAGFPWGGSEEQSDGNPNNGLSGYETGVGWISMNSADCDSDGNGISDTGNYANCPVGITVADYGVDIPAGSGNVTGTAWSKNIGWIDFAPAGPYPSVAT